MRTCQTANLLQEAKVASTRAQASRDKAESRCAELEGELDTQRAAATALRQVSYNCVRCHTWLSQIMVHAFHWPMTCADDCDWHESAASICFTAVRTCPVCWAATDAALQLVVSVDLLA